MISLESEMLYSLLLFAQNLLRNMLFPEIVLREQYHKKELFLFHAKVLIKHTIDG